MDIRDYARDVFKSQPFSRWIGARLMALGKDHAEISLAIDECHLQQYGFVHGGVISYLADNALTFAGGLALGGDAVTSEYKINYLQRASGATLVCRARTVSAGRRQAVCQAEIFSIGAGEEVMCAIAQGTIVAISGKVLEA